MIHPLLVGVLAGAAVSPLIAVTAAAAAHRPISWRRLWPAAAGAGAAAGAALAAAPQPPAVTATLAAAGGLVMAAVLVDAIEHRLPNALTVPLAAGGLPVVVLVSWVTGWGSPWRAVTGLLLFGGWMLILALTGAGAGDAKLAAGVGLWLGWISWWALAAGTLIALIGMAATDLTNRLGRGRPRSPLGPAIGVGMLVGIAVTSVLA